MRPVNVPGASQALERQFALRGHVGIQIDEVAVPVAVMGDFAGASPYEERVVGGDYVQSPPVVARFSGVLINGARGVITVVESLYLVGVAAARAYVLLFRPVDVAAVNVSSANQAVGCWNGLIRPGGFIPQIVGTYSLFDSAASGAPGGIIGQFDCPASQTVPWPGVQSRPVVLDGRDPQGPLSLAVINVVANSRIDVGWQVTEYPAQ